MDYQVVSISSELTRWLCIEDYTSQLYSEVFRTSRMAMI